MSFSKLKVILYESIKGVDDYRVDYVLLLLLLEKDYNSKILDNNVII